MPNSLLLTSCITAAAVGVLPGLARAQSNNASDVTGGNVTSSAIAGGGTVAAPASPAVAAVIAAGTTVMAQLASGTLTATTAGGTVVALPASVQAAVLEVLSGGSIPPDLVAGLAASGSGAQADDLARALRGLLATPASGQLVSAVGHFNAVVQAASPGFLENPTPQFLAVRSVLTRLVAAGQGDD